MSNLFKIATSHLVHSLCQVKDVNTSKCLFLNSYIEANYIRILPGSVISDCFIETSSLNVGKNTFVSGLTFQTSNYVLDIPSNLAVINVLTKDNENGIIIILGTEENPFSPINMNTGTFCNKSLLQLLKVLEINEAEIWDSDWGFKAKSLASAKLFAFDFCLQDVLYLFCCENPDSKHKLLMKRWKESKRYSICEILENIDHMKVLNRRRHVYAEISCKIIKKALCNNEDLHLLPYFHCGCSENWFPSIMDTLDNILLSDQSSVIKTRTLSNMADLLSIMAGITGGLRSGPGNNRAWEKAFELLLTGNVYSGMKALLSERSNWMDRPDHLMRAARHYERAAQILIQTSVNTVKKFIVLTPFKLPEIGSIITTECPARIDIQGGWSDTPPICYELGGSVVNIAVLIDGKKPIGARACRIPEPHIRLKIDVNELCHELLITDVKGILNYDQPNAKGALLKAAIICSEIIDNTSDISLGDQLFSKFGGGFEIQSWSLLPQGCGMGTSSILAGAIVAVLWSVTGKQFDKLSVVHAVLHVEQLLTTGGGWQDQVSGIMGGINRGYSDSLLPLQVKVDPIVLTEKIVKQLNARLLLIHTGKVRLAKNLLQNVIRNWYAREEIVVKCFKDLISNSVKMKDALQIGDFLEVGNLMEKYWEQKKILAPGCEPAVVKEIMHTLKPLCYGQLLVGAGGGGFMCVLTKEMNAVESLKLALKTHKEHQKFSVHKVTVDFTGLEFT